MMPENVENLKTINNTLNKIGLALTYPYCTVEEAETLKGALEEVVHALDMVIDIERKFNQSS